MKYDEKYRTSAGIHGKRLLSLFKKLNSGTCELYAISEGALRLDLIRKLQQQTWEEP
jgi:hypothetical protein